MTTAWKWILGLALATIVIVALFAWNLILRQGSYWMMGSGYGWHMPIVYGGGMMVLAWLVLIGLLIITVLGIAWLLKALAILK